MTTMADKCPYCGAKVPPFDDPCENCGALPPGSGYPEEETCDE